MHRGEPLAVSSPLAADRPRLSLRKYLGATNLLLPSAQIMKETFRRTSRELRLAEYGTEAVAATVKRDRHVPCHRDLVTDRRNSGSCSQRVLTETVTSDSNCFGDAAAESHRSVKRSDRRFADLSGCAFSKGN